MSARIKWVIRILILLSLMTTANANASGCIGDNTKVTLQGTIAKVPLTLANGKVNQIALLTLSSPICVIDSLSNDKGMVNEIQLIGTPPPLGVPVELSGTLTTGNITQYYARPTALEVSNGKRIDRSATHRDDVMVAFVPIVDQSFHLVMLTPYAPGTSGFCKGQPVAMIKDDVTGNTPGLRTENIGCWSYTTPDRSRVTVTYIDIEHKNPTPGIVRDQRRRS